MAQNKHRREMRKVFQSTIIAFICFQLALSCFVLAANEQQPLRPWLKNRGLLSRSAPANPPQAASSPAPSPLQASNSISVSATTSPAPPVVPAPVVSSQQQQQQQQQQATSNNLNRQLSSSNKASTIGTGSAIELGPQAAAASSSLRNPLSPSNASNGSNRTTRTAEIFDHNIIVTNTCERESMRVNVKMNRDFYGVIHTRNQRAKQACSVEGNGDREYNLDISQVLNSQDPAYCGVIKARKDSPDDKDILSVIIAVRLHRNIELSDDKFFLLNCTNRCRKADCSTPTNAKLADLNEAPNDETINNLNGRERENSASNNSEARDRNPGLNEECTIWKFPWVITLLWALGILLLCMIISHCIMCSSMFCRCVKTEVEEREASLYEGASDYDDDDHRQNVVQKSSSNKKSPYTIDYDNRDIYKTSNNYAPYCLDEAQTRSTSSARQKKHRKGSR